MGLVILILGVGSAAAADYWPGREWRTAEPESQGVDSDALGAVIDRVLGQNLGVHSLLVIRHGYLVLHADFYPYNSSSLHDLASVTKSVTSVLAGIAVGQGLIRMDQPMLSYFPKEAPANPDPRERGITVADVVHMESGFECGFAPGERELEQMKRTPDYLRFALSIPIREDPGRHASYCSPGYHILGSIIAAASHQTELDFARRNLFEPLGIRDVIWGADAQGRTHGWGDSHMYPEDIAKLGYLYLHGGQWAGRQIVPREWVAASVTPPPAGRGDPGGFGYGWWVSNGPDGLQYGGNGRGGQNVIVWPELDTVAIVLAGGNPVPLAPLIRKAIHPDGPLPANPEAYRHLTARVASVAKAPLAVPVPAPPPLAAKISGAVWDFPVNPSRLDSLALEFRAPADARVTVKYQGESFTFPVGMDGRYSLAPCGPFGLLGGAMGRWLSPSEFMLDLNFIANINHYSLRLRFDGDRVEMNADETSGLVRDGHIAGTRRATSN